MYENEELYKVDSKVYEHDMERLINDRYKHGYVVEQIVLTGEINTMRQYTIVFFRKNGPF